MLAGISILLRQIINFAAVAKISLWRLFLSCAILTLSACSSFLFYPQKNWVLTPGSEAYHFDAIQIPLADGVLLSAWRMPQLTVQQQGAVLFFHGNAGNISTDSQQVQWLT